MTVEDIIKVLGLKNSDFKTNGKNYIYNITDSDAFSHFFNLLDNDDRFEEDLDLQDINLFTNNIVFLEDTGKFEITMVADFEHDIYTLTITEV